MVNKQDIVDVATELFAERGFRATTVADIAKGVGLSPSAGGLYRHFRSKDELIGAVVDATLEKLVVVLAEKDLLLSEGLDPAEEAPLVAGFLIERIRSSAAELTVIESLDDPDMQERVANDLVRPTLAGFEEWLCHLAERTGSRTISDPQGWTAVLWNALYHFARRPHINPDIDDQQFCAGWTSLLLGALNPTASAAAPDPEASENQSEAPDVPQ